MNDKISRRAALKKAGLLGLAGAALPTVAACSTGQTVKKTLTLNDIDMSTPEKRSAVITKVMGSTGKEETHAFMRIHLYGLVGDNNIVPFFSMNNYVVQKWEPAGDGTFNLKHYEVGYYCDFDTDNPISNWHNPIVNKTVELEPFILGPVFRSYTPKGIIAPGLAPNPMRINVIGDRVFIPAQSIEKFPNIFTPKEWPEYSSGPTIFWDSMYTFSARIADVIDPQIMGAPAEMHMQNLTSWQPFLRMGQTPGRSMARGFGSNISGFDALEPHVRAAFEKYTPEIFETATWENIRFDSADFYNKAVAEREAEKAKQEAK